MQVAIPLFPRFTALDAIGPYEVLQRVPTIDVTFVGHERGEVRSDNGMLGITIDATFEELANPDIVVFPGGVGTRPLVHDERVLSWVRAAYETATYMTSVCTGSLVLGGAGLLNGLTATTHWACYPELEATGAVPTAQRVVEHLDRKIITAAGVSSGIDMALRLVELLIDRVGAQAAQLMISTTRSLRSTAARWGSATTRSSTGSSSTHSCASSRPSRSRQKVVAQKVSPCGNEACVLTSVAPHNAPSMPLTMPRSTAQITGCSMATSPNGQWLLTMRSWLLR